MCILCLKGNFTLYMFPLQVIVLNVTPQSSVVLEVRDHFGSHNQPDYSHFLGKAELWVADFLAFDWAW